VLPGLDRAQRRQDGAGEGVNEALVPILGPAEARRLIDEVKRDAERLWAKFLEPHEGEAHLALGYSSWAPTSRPSSANRGGVDTSCSTLAASSSQ
jgi:hypothetical protein